MAAIPANLATIQQLYVPTTHVYWYQREVYASALLNPLSLKHTHTTRYTDYSVQKNEKGKKPTEKKYAKFNTMNVNNEKENLIQRNYKYYNYKHNSLR